MAFTCSSSLREIAPDGIAGCLWLAFASCISLRDPAPWGIFGGHDGKLASTTKNPGQPDAEEWPSKFTNGRMSAGDRVQIIVPSSGGYGNPLERDPRQVVEDVLDGYTSLEQARKDYRVAIDPDTLELDAEKTRQLRAAAEAIV